MPQFVINNNEQTNGDHEIHNKTDGCRFMPNIENQIDLGYHPSCREAVIYAKTRWPNKRINGCYYCCNPCHTT